jgi:predicted alpha/beta hydrolase
MAHDQSTLSVGTTNHRFELIYVKAPNPVAGVLMVPAMGISARHYIPFAKALARTGIHTYIHEWRGLGSSSLRADRNTSWGYQELLIDLEASLEMIFSSEADTSLRPFIVAGHSLGSQLALLLHATSAQSLSGAICIAGGSPFYKAFGWPMKWALTIMFGAMPRLAHWLGHYPGYRLGFAGREARGVMDDWAASGRTGRYEPSGVPIDLEQSLASMETPLLGIRMADDWFVPPSSLNYLMNKCPNAIHHTIVIDSQSLSGPADHYRWMKTPNSTAQAIKMWLDDQVMNSASIGTNR